MNLPNCYKCVYRRDIPGDAHSSCTNLKAVVSGIDYGIRKGWFDWPVNFDPLWLESCSGFSDVGALRVPDLIDEGGSF